MFSTDNVTKQIQRSEVDKKSKRSQRLVDKKFALMGDIVDRFQTNSQRAYSPEFSLTIDEQLFPCKSRCKYTQYMPNKPDKYGIKFWLLAELESKYCLAISPYCGADDSRVESLGTHVVPVVTIFSQISFWQRN